MLWPAFISTDWTNDMPEQTSLAAQAQQSPPEQGEVCLACKRRIVAMSGLLLSRFPMSVALTLNVWSYLRRLKWADNNENGEMDAWHTATIAEVRRLITKDLRACDDKQVGIFEQYGIKPFLAPITRYGKRETVVVVARKGDEVIYYEDMDEGFNVSPISTDGFILEHWCNQDELGFALNTWVEGRGSRGKLRPSTSRDSSVLQERRESMILERLWLKETFSRKSRFL